MTHCESFGFFIMPTIGVLPCGANANFAGLVIQQLAVGFGTCDIFGQVPFFELLGISISWTSHITIPVIVAVKQQCF